MPNIKDFSVLKSIKTITCNPKGWINPLQIEYGIAFEYTAIYYWRIVGTTHTFTIPVDRLNYICAGDFKTHFEEMLEAFREDYMQWKDRVFDVPWMQEYYQQYNDFIA